MWGASTKYWSGSARREWSHKKLQGVSVKFQYQRVKYFTNN